MASLLEGPQTGAAMSSRQVFQAQLASIMEVLANAAVAEICKLVDNDYAVLNLQMSQCQHENKDLKRRLHELELKVAREQAEKRLSVVNSNVNNNNNNNNKTISSSCGSPPPVDIHSVFAGAAHMTQLDMGLWQSSKASEDPDVKATHSRAPHCDAHEEQPQEPGAATLKEEITQEGGEDDTDMEVALGLLKQEEGAAHVIQMDVGSKDLDVEPTHSRATHHDSNHISMQKGKHLPPVQMCTDCCSLYHCPLCTKDIFKPTTRSRLNRHLQAHLGRAVNYNGYCFYKCNLGCRAKAHFHCFCKFLFLKKNGFLNHLRKKHCTSPGEELQLAGDALTAVTGEEAGRSLTGEEAGRAHTMFSIKPQIRQTVSCPKCNMSMNKKNLSKHILRKHSGVHTLDVPNNN